MYMYMYMYSVDTLVQYICSVASTDHYIIHIVTTCYTATYCKATFLCVRNLCEFVKTGLLINLCVLALYA